MQRIFLLVVGTLPLCIILLNAVGGTTAAEIQTQGKGQPQRGREESGKSHRHHQHGTGQSHEHTAKGKRSADEGAEADQGEEARGKSIRRHPVQLYKGAEPWRPLSNSLPFGVGPVELPPAASIDEEEQQQESTGQREAQPLASVDAPTDNVPAQVPGILNGVAAINASDQLDESVAFEYTEGGPKRSKNGLHESLRRPLRRLTDRQLALLLKQIRKQRREQFGQRENNENSPISTRQEMLDQLKNLLKQPQDGQRLIRPKLLTNVNILPNEWSIYPPPRNIGTENGSDRDQKLVGGQANGAQPTEQQQKEQQKQQQQQLTETVQIGGENQRGEAELRKDGDEAISITEAASSSSTPTQPTTAVDPILTQPQFELKATIRPPIVQSVLLVPEQKTTDEQKAKLETDQHHQQNNQKEEEEEKRSAKLEEGWQKEEQKLMAEMRTAVQKADSAMEKLENQRRETAAQENKSEGQPPSAKLATKTSGHDQSEIKLFNVSKFSEQERSELGELSAALREIRFRYETVKHEFQHKMKRMGLAHRFKTSEQVKAAGTTTFTGEEPQNGTGTDLGLVLSSNKTAENSEGGNGTNGEKTTGGTTAEQKPTKKATTAPEEDHTTAVPIPNGQRNRRPTDGNESANKNETKNDEEGIINVGKTKSKLTLAELAEELEQIERTIATGKGKAGLKELEIESGTLQKAKKILQKDKKAKPKNRARVSSSGTPKALANGGGNSQSVAINKIVEKIKKATALKDSQHKQHHQQQQKKAEKQQQGHKSHGNSSENTAKWEAQQTAKPTQQPQAVQPLGNIEQQQQQHQTHKPKQTIPFVKITAKGTQNGKSQPHNAATTETELNKLKTVVVDTSTAEHGKQRQHSAEEGQQNQQQNPNQNQQQYQNHYQNQQNQNQQGQPHEHHNYNQNVNNQFDQQKHEPHHKSATAHFYYPQQQQFHTAQQLNIPQQHLPQSDHINQQKQQQQQQPFDHPQKLPHQSQQTAIVQQPQSQKFHQQHRHGQGQRPNSAGGGFYQLERAQVTEVSQKTPKPPSSDLKLKGVAQLEVAKSNDQQQRGPEELSSSQLSNRLRKEWLLKKNGTKPPKEDEDLANLEEFARIDEQAICDAIACNFETGALCEWESSIDELNPNDPRYRRYLMARTMLLARHRRRSKRRGDEVAREEPKLEEGEEEEKAEGEDEMAEFGQNLLLTDTAEEQTTTAKTKHKKTDQRKDERPPQGERTVLRSWHNWVGRYRNRLTGITQSEVFSTRNQRFAASYLKPGQRSTLIGRLLSGDRATIRFKAWEATRSLQLRVCCDRTDRDEDCVFSTELDVKHSSRKWTDHLATCPQGTKKIVFECRNLGPFQGACGVDNIQLVNAYCPSVTPMKANRKL